MNVAVDAMRAGAIDFLMKPFNADRLRVTLKNAIEKMALTRVVKSLQQDYGRDRFESFIGSSLPMQSVYRIIENAGPSKATVFITGESGTGKELCAEAVHLRSPRRGGPFITLNCAAIPKDLIESEIFGHVRGAFTGATSDRDGAASLADGGTLFLDEICEMDLRLQTKLLRFIQTGTIQKVGGTTSQEVDVRFVCATNRDPLKAVERGEFREDLYYRLHVVPVHLPPLRDRGEDVLLIATALLGEFSQEESKEFKGFSKEVEHVIATHDWPGNVRQLQNVLRNIVVLNDGEEVTFDMLPPPLNGEPAEIDGLPGGPAFGNTNGLTYPSDVQPTSEPAATSFDQAPMPARQTTPTYFAAKEPGTEAIRPLWIQEREIIENAIARCDNNIPRAAAHLGISASTIYRKRQMWQERDNQSA